MTGANFSACRSCDADVLWVKMATSARRHPLNALPDLQRGNIEVADDGTAQTLSRQGAADARLQGAQLYLSHWATCPYRDMHAAGVHRPPTSPHGQQSTLPGVTTTQGKDQEVLAP